MCAQVLERALPESADQLLQLIMQHTAAGPAARFAATQLLMIATTCVVSAGVPVCLEKGGCMPCCHSACSLAQAPIFCWLRGAPWCAAASSFLIPCTPACIMPVNSGKEGLQPATIAACYHCCLLILCKTIPLLIILICRNGSMQPAAIWLHLSCGNSSVWTLQQ